MAKPSASPAAASDARRSARRHRPPAAGGAPCRARRERASWSPPRRSASASPSTDASEATSARRPPPLARRANHEVAEIGAEAVGAAEQFAVVKNAEAEAALDVDDEKIVQVARLPEPVLGERDEIDVAVDRNRDAEPPGEIGAERHVALLQNGALPADAGRALDDAGQADADAGDLRHLEAGVADAAAHAVLDQIGDDGGRLAVDADRQRQRRAGCRRRNW